ncbi:unnamed protein product [Prorocentrum cordatum]|uniref:EF-hand domain-containing protein n=1 Tax=Prorocentrum cordatum TaxID=2364126 RepID=A0ABN9U0P9_9DINO|nr:unnamed protein product [Polarella glacialis]
MLASARGVDGLHAAEGTDSGVDEEAALGSRPGAPRQRPRLPQRRPAAAGRTAAALVVACAGAAAAAAALWRGAPAAARGGIREGDAWENLLESLHTSSDKGSLTMSAVTRGSTMVEVQKPQLFHAGDKVVMVNTAHDSGGASAEGVVAFIEGSQVVLRDPIKSAFPAYSFMIVRAATPTPANTALAPPASAPTAPPANPALPKPAPAAPQATPAPPAPAPVAPLANPALPQPAPAAPQATPAPPAPAPVAPPANPESHTPTAAPAAPRTNPPLPTPTSAPVAPRTTSTLPAPRSASHVDPPANPALPERVPAAPPASPTPAPTAPPTPHPTSDSDAGIVPLSASSDAQETSTSSAARVSPGQSGLSRPRAYLSRASTVALFAVVTCCACGLFFRWFRGADRQTDEEHVDPRGVKTRTTLPATAGQAVLRTASTGGFCVGDKVLISSGDGDEFGIIHDLQGGDTMVLVQPLEHRHPTGATILSRGAGAHTPRRSAMVNELFQVLDADGNHHLNRSELMVLAKLDGFTGSNEEWKKEYSKFALTHFHKERSLGCNRCQFASLVNDRDAFYLTDEEIRRYTDDIRHYMDTLKRIDIGGSRR